MPLFSEPSPFFLLLTIVLSRPIAIETTTMPFPAGPLAAPPETATCCWEGRIVLRAFRQIRTCRPWKKLKNSARARDPQTLGASRAGAATVMLYASPVPARPLVPYKLLLRASETHVHLLLRAAHLVFPRSGSPKATLPPVSRAQVWDVAIPRLGYRRTQWSQQICSLNRCISQIPNSTQSHRLAWPGPTGP